MFLRRAWSTRIRRIICDASPKNWERFCQRRLLIGKAQVRLVHEGRRLQRVVAALSAQVRRGATPELLIDDRYEAVCRSRLAGSPCTQQRGDFDVVSHLQTHRTTEWRCALGFLASLTGARETMRR